MDEKRGPGRPTEFATDTAKVSGESRSGIYQHLARAEAIAVLRFMAKNEMFDRSETDAVLENLVG